MPKSIKRFLKKFFIPHRANGHKPHILRERSVLLILCAILFIEALYVAQSFIFLSKTDFFAAIQSEALIDLANQNRKNTKLSPLSANSRLAMAAQMKADDMAQKGYFSHTSPEGLTPWFWFEKTGYKFVYAGENLAINFHDTNDVNNAWMASPAHRSNILNRYFTEVGIGVSKGIYEGRESIFVVELFGKPEKKLAKAASVSVGKIKKSIVQNGSPLPNLNKNQSGIDSEQKIVKGSFEDNNKIKENFAEEINFVAVNQEGKEIAEITAASETDKNSFSYFAEIFQLLSMPRFISNYVFGALFLLILLALVLKIFIKIKIQYPALIVNGVFLLAVIYFIFLVNKFTGIIGANIR